MHVATVSLHCLFVFWNMLPIWVHQRECFIERAPTRVLCCVQWHPPLFDGRLLPSSPWCFSRACAPSASLQGAAPAANQCYHSKPSSLFALNSFLFKSTAILKGITFFNSVYLGDFHTDQEMIARWRHQYCHIINVRRMFTTCNILKSVWELPTFDLSVFITVPLSTLDTAVHLFENRWYEQQTASAFLDPWIPIVSHILQMEQEVKHVQKSESCCWILQWNSNIQKHLLDLQILRSFTPKVLWSIILTACTMWYCRAVLSAPQLQGHFQR